MPGNLSAPGATVAGRVVQVLSAFDARHRTLTLSDLARRSDLALSTAHRLAGELTAAGALQRTTDGRYAVGRLIWDVGLLAPVEADLRQVAEPFLHDVYAATRATVHLAVRDGRHALYLERMRGRSSVPVVSSTGSRLPLHATGVGKVLLAHAPEDVIAEALEHLEPITAFTLTDPAQLRTQLTRIRELGHASTYEEMTLGACSIAVPIRREQRVVASIGAVVANLRRDKGRLLAALQVAAHGIGRQLWAHDLSAEQKSDFPDRGSLG